MDLYSAYQLRKTSNVLNFFEFFLITIMSNQMLRFMFNPQFFFTRLYL